MPIKIIKNRGINIKRQLFLSRHTARTICSFALLIQPYVNSRKSFVFALMKCSKAAFGEQNKKCFYSVLGILHAVGGVKCLVFSV